MSPARAVSGVCAPVSFHTSALREAFCFSPPSSLPSGPTCRPLPPVCRAQPIRKGGFASANGPAECVRASYTGQATGRAIRAGVVAGRKTSMCVDPIEIRLRLLNSVECGRHARQSIPLRTGSMTPGRGLSVAANAFASAVDAVPPPRTLTEGGNSLPPMGWPPPDRSRRPQRCLARSRPESGQSYSPHRARKPDSPPPRISAGAGECRAQGREAVSPGQSATAARAGAACRSAERRSRRRPAPPGGPVPG